MAFYSHFSAKPTNPKKITNHYYYPKLPSRNPTQVRIVGWKIVNLKTVFATEHERNSLSESEQNASGSAGQINARDPPKKVKSL